MALTANNIITDRVRVLLRDIDAGGVQWKDAELIAWLNDACSEIARLRPESASSTTDEALIAGAKQSIPAGGTMLLEVICNMDGADEGRVVRRVERATLDNEDVNWMSAPQQKEVYRHIASLTDPRTFYVYPPNNGTGALRLVYASAPTVVTALNNPFPLPDIYAAAAVNYICSRAFKKLTESGEAQARATEYMQMFNGQMASTEEAMEGRNSKVRQPTYPDQPMPTQRVR